MACSGNKIGKWWKFFVHAHLPLSQLLISSLNTFSALSVVHAVDPTNCLRHQITFLYFISFPRDRPQIESSSSSIFLFPHHCIFFSTRAHTTVQFGKRIEKIWTVIRVRNITLWRVRQLETRELCADERAYNEAARVIGAYRNAPVLMWVTIIVVCCRHKNAPA
jgi:hypothetical protein